jgi:hypothetical protein
VVCPVPNRLARASAFSASASVPVVADCVVVAPVPNRSARALRFLSSSSIDDAERPILRSTAEASLVSVVAEPSRDVRAGCGGASEGVSAQTTAVRQSDWRGGVGLTSSGLPALSALGGALPIAFEGGGSAATAGAAATASDVLVGSGATSKRWSQRYRKSTWVRFCGWILPIPFNDAAALSASFNRATSSAFFPEWGRERPLRISVSSATVFFW